MRVNLLNYICISLTVCYYSYYAIQFSLLAYVRWSYFSTFGFDSYADLLFTPIGTREYEYCQVLNMYELSRMINAVEYSMNVVCLSDFISSYLLGFILSFLVQRKPCFALLSRVSFFQSTYLSWIDRVVMYHVQALAQHQSGQFSYDDDRGRDQYFVPSLLDVSCISAITVFVSCLLNCRVMIYFYELRLKKPNIVTDFTASFYILLLTN